MTNVFQHLTASTSLPDFVHQEYHELEIQEQASSQKSKDLLPLKHSSSCSHSFFKSISNCSETTQKNLDEQHGVSIFHHQPHLNSNLSNPSQLNDLTICQCTSDPPCIWTNVPPWILHRNARTYEDHSISCWVSQHPLGCQSLVH